MEPRQFEESQGSRGEGQASPTRQPDWKRRFRIIKLGERIAPGGGGDPDSVVSGGFPHCSSHHQACWRSCGSRMTISRVRPNKKNPARCFER
jgi:hypothetical protein